MMKLAFAYAALFVTFAVTPNGARAEEEPTVSVIHEITLDIDHDGRIDRVALVKREVGTAADLLIYLAPGDERLDLSRPPTILKKGLADGHVMALERSAKGSLLVNFGCGGCSNDVETKLTIVHRDGEFWVAGFSYGWETRDWGTGSCDINFLTGKGVRSRELAKSRSIRARFSRIRLADWSSERQQNLLQRYCFEGS
jgi:hypothetical protein